MGQSRIHKQLGHNIQNKDKTKDKNTENSWK